MWTSLLTIAASVLAAFGAVRFLLLVLVRIHATTARYLAMTIRERGLRRFVLSDEYGEKAADQLEATTAIVWLPTVGPVWLSFSERMMQAGFSGKDVVCSLLCARWQLRRVRAFLTALESERRTGERTPVELVTPYGLDPIGFISEVQEPFLEHNQYADIDGAVAACAKGQGRAGVILHGTPGNGKTSLVKWLARRHRMPVRLFMFTPDMNNATLTRMFAQLPPRSLVLFEDFDAHFNGRVCDAAVSAGEPGKPTVPQASCGATFDALLNGFDGVYNAYDGVVFVLTVNDLSRVDDALKRRPSRFRFVREVPCPSAAVRARIFGERDGAPDGLSLDELLAWKENGNLTPAAPETEGGD